MSKLMMFLPVAIELLTGWLQGRVKTDKDERNAAIVTSLVESAARWIVIANPNKDWATLVDMVVKTVSPRIPKDTDLYDLTNTARGAVMTVLKTYRGQVDPLPEPWEAGDVPLPSVSSEPLGGSVAVSIEQPS